MRIHFYLAVNMHSTNASYKTEHVYFTCMFWVNIQKLNAYVTYSYSTDNLKIVPCF